MSRNWVALRHVLFNALSSSYSMIYATSMVMTLPARHACLLNTRVAHRRLAQHFVNNIWAMVSTSLFYPVEVSDYIEGACGVVNTPVTVWTDASCLLSIECLLIGM